MALSFPILQAKKLMMVLIVLLVLTSVSLAAWGISGADPFTLLKFAFTSQPTFKTIVKYSDEGELLKDKIVYQLGAPELIEDCMSSHLHNREEHFGEEMEDFNITEGGESITWVWCAKG